MNQTDTVEKLGKASKHAALMSLFGVIVVFLSLGYSAYQLRSLEKRKQKLQDDIDMRKTDIDTLKKQEKTLRDNIQAINNTKVGSQGQVFQLKASAKEIEGRRTGNGLPVYSFTVFVDASDAVLNNIAKVTYFFNNDTFKQPHRVATTASNKFAVQYPGWGCLDDVDVTLYFKDGTTQSLAFNQCQSLGPEWT